MITATLRVPTIRAAFPDGVIGLPGPARIGAPGVSAAIRPTAIRGAIGTPSRPGVLSYLAAASANGDAVMVYKTAAQPLEKNRAVYLAADGLRYADPADVDNADAVLGITTHSAAVGQGVLVQTAGEITDVAFAWTPREPMYLGAAGTMTQTSPVAGVHVELGFALTAGAAFIRIQRAIYLPGAVP